MVPFICRCCGTEMSAGAKENPNICSTCAMLDWENAGEFDEPLAVGASSSARTVEFPQTPSELEHLLEADSPTVVECYNAVEEAERALAESTIKEASGTVAPAKTYESIATGSKATSEALRVPPITGVS